MRAHAFGPGLPDRDLVLSRQHRIVVESATCELLFGESRAFVLAGHLPAGLASSPDPTEDVVYFHILLETHEILLANGLAAESFQPARRLIETLSVPTRQSLDEVLAVLGEEAMLTRPDALPTLTQHEAHLALNDVAAGVLPLAEDQPAAIRVH